MSDTSPASTPDGNMPNDRRWAWIVAAGAMLITLVPYLIGAALADGRRYMWLGYNVDDSCVYLSWMRQASEGVLRALNLFTTEPQKGMALNPLFLVLGRFAALTHLPLLAVYHLSRMAFGFGLLMVVWKFIVQTIADRHARRLAFLFVCFSAGLGWLPFWWNLPTTNSPVDTWQPEAITFLSLYLNPLFCFSMLLQVGIVASLLQGERNGQMRCAVTAGACGFLLGLIHSYDIITMSAVWIVYLLVNALRSLKIRDSHSLLAAWLHAVVAGLMTAPAVAYIYLQLRNEAVFRARANVATYSPALLFHFLPIWVILGYGLTFVLAVVGGYVLWKQSAGTPPDAAVDTQRENKIWTTGVDAARLLVVWACVNIAVSYLPLPFQRKMLQGAHFPIAILAGIGAAWLIATKLTAATPRKRAAVAAGLTLLLSLTNIQFLARDIANDTINRAQTLTQRPYLQPGEMEALDWIAANTPKDAAIQPLPWVAAGDGKIAPVDMSIACFTPGLIGRKVYCGHWGETPDYPAKLSQLVKFGLPSTTDQARTALLRKMKVRYLLFSQKSLADESADQTMPFFRGRLPLPPYLSIVHANDDATVYEVNSSVF